MLNCNNNDESLNDFQDNGMKQCKYKQYADD